MSARQIGQSFVTLLENLSCSFVCWHADLNIPVQTNALFIAGEMQAVSSVHNTDVD